jgi:glycerol-3-phosphate cytidylyltransferase
MITGFTCGTFDLFHAGHILMLDECKKQCDHLIVGIQTNPHLDRKDKNKPIQSIVERQIEVSACKYVDDIIVYETEEDLNVLLCTLPINVRFIGKDWEGKQITGGDICKRRGIEIVYNKRDHPFSTTELKERIKCS